MINKNMKHKVKLKIGWSGKRWYVVQRKWFIFWFDIHDYESSDEANNVCNQLNDYK